MTVEQLTYVGVIAVAVAIVAGYNWRYRSATKRARRKLRKSIEAGLSEPVTLHPEVSPNRCIGTSSCVKACPNGALRLVADRPVRAQDLCVACGACARACVTGAMERIGREMTAEQVAAKVAADHVGQLVSQHGTALRRGPRPPPGWKQDLRAQPSHGQRKANRRAFEDRRAWKRTRLVS